MKWVDVGATVWMQGAAVPASPAHMLWSSLPKPGDIRLELEPQRSMVAMVLTVTSEVSAACQAIPGQRPGPQPCISSQGDGHSGPLWRHAAHSSRGHSPTVGSRSLFWLEDHSSPSLGTHIPLRRRLRQQGPSQLCTQGLSKQVPSWTEAVPGPLDPSPGSCQGQELGRAIW